MTQQAVALLTYTICLVVGSFSLGRIYERRSKPASASFKSCTCRSLTPDYAAGSGFHESFLELDPKCPRHGKQADRGREAP